MCIGLTAVREFQLPYCSLNFKGALVAEVLQALNATVLNVGSCSSFSLVEVGAALGDCTLLVHALASRSNVRFQATVFEPNPETAPILEGNLKLNFAASDDGTVHTAIVGNMSGQLLPLAVGLSSVHTAVAFSPFAQETEFHADRVHQVRTTTLDDEMSNGPIDLLLIATNGFDAEVLAGAQRILSARIPRVIFAITGHWPTFKEALQQYDYVFEQTVAIGEKTWVVARAHGDKNWLVSCPNP